MYEGLGQRFSDFLTSEMFFIPLGVVGTVLVVDHATLHIHWL
jgi:hypothetical protein